MLRFNYIYSARREAVPQSLALATKLVPLTRYDRPRPSDCKVATIKNALLIAPLSICALARALDSVVRLFEVLFNMCETSYEIVVGASRLEFRHKDRDVCRDDGQLRAIVTELRCRVGQPELW